MNRPDIVSQAGGILWVPGVRNKKARRLWEVLDEFGLTDLATLADRGCQSAAHAQNWQICMRSASRSAGTGARSTAASEMSLSVVVSRTMWL